MTISSKSSSSLSWARQKTSLDLPLLLHAVKLERKHSRARSASCGSALALQSKRFSDEVVIGNATKVLVQDASPDFAGGVSGWHLRRVLANFVACLLCTSTSCSSHAPGMAKEASQSGICQLALHRRTAPSLGRQAQFEEVLN